MKKVKTKKKLTINSLYIHIPFCKNICPYCDFFKLLIDTNFEDKFVNELIKDLKETSKKYTKFKTIYIGGGTPTILKLNNLELILKELYKLKRKNCEFTIEANPEDINENLLKLLVKYGINRISIGIQSFNKDTLTLLGRDSQIDFNNLIFIVKKYIKNINLDFIYGLPNENLEDIKYNLNKFLQLDVNHISLYSLTISKNTYFYNKGYKEISNDESRKIYDYIVKKLKENGFIHYEVSNFAKKGYESKHNINYWKDNYYIGIGPGASGYLNNIRYTNSKNFSNYLSGKREREEDTINFKTKKEEFLMLNFRLKSGFKYKDYKKIFKTNFLEEVGEYCEVLQKNKLLKMNKNNIYLTYEGQMIMDSILLKIYDKI